MTAPYRPGQPISLEIDPSQHGAAGAVQASFVVRDPTGDEVQPERAAVLSGQVFKLDIAALANITDQFFDSRLVYVTFETANGPVEAVLFYEIQTTRQLRVPDESIQTYEEAELFAKTMVKMDGWAAASKDQRIAALIDSTNSMKDLPWKTCGVAPTVEHLTNCPICSNPFLLPAGAIRAHAFWTSLRIAQLRQANYLLGGNPLEDLRAAGLMSNTVGESSQMYRPRAPLNLPLTKEAIRPLGRWLSFSVKLQRG